MDPPKPPIPNDRELAVLGAAVLARRRANDIAKLQAEGCFDPQKRLRFLRPPEQVAVLFESAGPNRTVLTDALADHLIPLSVLERVPPPDQDKVGWLIETLQTSDRHRFDLIVLATSGADPAAVRLFNDERFLEPITEGSIPVWTAFDHTGEITLAEHAAQCRFKRLADVGNELLRLHVPHRHRAAELARARRTARWRGIAELEV